MFSISVMTLHFVLSSYLVSFGDGQDIFFGLKHHREDSQILYVNETDVMITCNVSCITTASIQIQNIITDAGSFSDRGNSLDYPISVVSENLHFRCVVTYNTPALEVTKETHWSPHVVREPGQPYCYRNGTVSQPYSIGDILLLGCLCDIQQLCKWKVFITAGPESEKLNETYLNYTSTPLDNENRVLLETVVGPIENLPPEHLQTYLCISNLTYPKRQTCVIQPRKASSEDNVINQGIFNSLVKPIPTQSTNCNLFETFNVQIATTSNERLTDSIYDLPGPTVSPSLSDYVLFIALGTISFLVILVLVIVVICVRAIRKRHVKNRRDARNEQRTADSPEFHLYDRSRNESYIHSIPTVYGSTASSFIKDNKPYVEQTIDDKYEGTTYPYYSPFSIERSESLDYSNVTPYYVNGAQL